MLTTKSMVPPDEVECTWSPTGSVSIRCRCCEPDGQNGFGLWETSFAISDSLTLVRLLIVAGETGCRIKHTIVSN